MGDNYLARAVHMILRNRTEVQLRGLLETCLEYKGCRPADLRARVHHGGEETKSGLDSLLGVDCEDP